MGWEIGGGGEEEVNGKQGEGSKAKEAARKGKGREGESTSLYTPHLLIARP